MLDLGCSPGSWLIYAAKLIGETGRAVGVDLKPVTSKLPSNASAHIGDLMNMTDALRETMGDRFNVVLSDMAPDTTAIKISTPSVPPAWPKLRFTSPAGCSSKAECSCVKSSRIGF